MIRSFCIILFLPTLPLLVQAAASVSELGERYSPYADRLHDIEARLIETAPAANIWWRSPDEIRSAREESDLPLSGLHLAIDPGHIGGEWAEVEGRHFNIKPEDFPVREGELVLEVARLVRAKLVELGAEVTLLRDATDPTNPKRPEAYYAAALQSLSPPKDSSWAAFGNYALALHRTMNRMSVITGELVERARLVNEDVQPDALLSLHINAAPWLKDEKGATNYELVDSNHAHVLIFGCLSDAELSSPRQQEQLLVKLQNGSGPVECELGQALGVALERATSLPPAEYSGKNAIRLKGHTPYLWARNLMMLRYVECPVVLLEPYIANSKSAYPRLQAAIKSRRAGERPVEDDILVEYAGAVVEGLLQVYGPRGN